VIPHPQEACKGKSVAEITSIGPTILPRDAVMKGVGEVIGEIQKMCHLRSQGRTTGVYIRGYPILKKQDTTR
jgi:urease gamma subunit